MKDDVLIVGASGFIGRILTEGLSKSRKIGAIYHSSTNYVDFVNTLPTKQNIELIQCDLTDKDNILQIRDSMSKYDYCIFLAANTLTPLSIEYPSTDVYKNIITLTQFLEQYEGRRFIYFSSGAVYEGNIGPVSPESMCRPTLPYAISKLAAEGYVKNFVLRKKTIDEYFNVRFFGAFGKHEPVRKIYSKIIRAALDEKVSQFQIYGNGMNYIDALYADDVVSAVEKLLSTKKYNLTLDLCLGEPKSVMELCYEVLDTLNRNDIDIVTINDKPAEFNLFYSIDSRMRRLIGWNNKFSFKDGIKLAIENIKKENHSYTY